MSPYKLTVKEGLCLLYISLHPNTTPHLISKHLVLDSSHVHKIINKLLSKGLIKQNKKQHKRYNIPLAITNQGKTITQRLNSCLGLFLKDAFSNYSSDEIITFMTIFSTLKTSLYNESLSAKTFSTPTRPLTNADFLLMNLVQLCWRKKGYISCQECSSSEDCDIFF